MQYSFVLFVSATGLFQGPLLLERQAGFACCCWCCCCCCCCWVDKREGERENWKQGVANVTYETQEDSLRWVLLHRLTYQVKLRPFAACAEVGGSWENKRESREFLFPLWITYFNSNHRFSAIADCWHRHTSRRLVRSVQSKCFWSHFVSKRRQWWRDRTGDFLTVKL